MSSDMFSSHGREKAYEPWYEKEQRTWVEFRNGCRGREGVVCYIMDARHVCREDNKEKCPLWYLKNFKVRNRRKN